MIARLLCAALLVCALAPAARAQAPGVYAVLEIEQPQLRAQRLIELSETMTRALREVTPATADASTDESTARIRVDDPRQHAAAQTAIEAALASSGMRKWVRLSTAGGWIEARFTEAGWAEILRQTQVQSLAVIRRRLDPRGELTLVLEPRPNGRLFVRDPQERDVERLRARIGVTGALTFHLVRHEFDAWADQPLPNDVILAPAHTSADTQVPEIVDRAPLMTGERLARAAPAEDVHTGQVVLSFQFDSSGARIFCQITREHVGARFAILLDGQVLTAPRINEAICGGSGQISGNFDAESASNLAVLLRSGALPAALRVIEQGVTSP